MEFEATNTKGERVSKGYNDITKVMSKSLGLDYAGIGSQPTSAKFRNNITGKEQEMDLREVLTNAGWKDVQFKFDPAKAKEQGHLVPSGEMKEHAYNLERIRHEKGRMAYLKDKGFDSVINDGDDYYGVRGGKMIAINNQLGLDTSDVFRFMAHAGRDIGAVVGVAATGVGAAATGGASLALAGAAGAGGAVVGEMAQRGIESLMGSDIGKYNEDMSLGEEALSLGKDAAMGAIGGVGGQFAGKAIGAMSTAGAKGASAVAQKVGFAEEFTRNLATKTEAGYLASKLPQGWLAKTATSEEAVAMDLLKQTSNKGVKGLEGESLLGEAKATLASGSSKLTPAQQAEQRTQAGLYNQARQGLLKEQTKQVDDHVINEATIATERTKSILTDNSYKIFKGRESQIDKIVGKDVPLPEKRKAFQAIEKDMYKQMEKMGVKVDVKDGYITHIDDASLLTVQTKTMDDFVGASQQSILQSARMNTINKPIPDEVAAPAYQNIMESATKLKDSQKSVFDFAESLKQPDPRKTQEALVGLTEKIFKDIEKNDIPIDSARVIIDDLHKVLISSGKSTELAVESRIGADKLLSAMSYKKMLSTDNPQMKATVLRELKDVAGTLGGGDESISLIARLEFQKGVLKGDINKELYQLMTPQDRMLVNAYDMLKSQTIGGGENMVESGIKSLLTNSLKKVGIDADKPIASAVRGGLAYATGGSSIAVEQAYHHGGKQVLKAGAKGAMKAPKARIGTQGALTEQGQ